VIVRLDEVGSTNDEAFVRARAGAPHGTAIVALRQTAGRGRLGRVWQTMRGGLAMSVVLRPATPVAAWPVLVLAGAAAVAELLDLHIKWPNDLVFEDGRKVGGVLAEADAAAGILVVGLGLNVREAPDGAGALSERGPVPDGLDEIVRAAVAGASPSLHVWRARAWGLGRRVAVGGVEGVAEGVEDDGALRIRTDDGARISVRAGDVSLIG
jgi:BirA family biotin operon repressor/biotin-[acetyl-CoA-carboxylase] ligase